MSFLSAREAPPSSMSPRLVFYTLLRATLGFVCSVGWCSVSLAEPFLAPGDLWLRDDLYTLADAGVLTSPLSSWPLSVGDLAEDLNAYSELEIVEPAVVEAYARVRETLRGHMRLRLPQWHASARFADEPQRIRPFSETPRGRHETSVAGTVTGERFAGRLQVNYIRDDPADDDNLRFDGSYASVALGNWLVSASLQDRFWGPGWESGLLLTNSARPIPAIALQRNFSTPFESRWLKWIGPWSTSLLWGQLEDDRAVPKARFFAWRANAKPLPGLELGVQRGVQWCGAGRDCTADAFFRSLVGDSNLDEGVTVDVANQIAGFDARWASPIGDWPYALYGQFVGEDEAGGFPSKYLGQFGLEIWGRSKRFAANWRAYVEYADTTCQFNESSRIFNCAYNNGSYPNGLRFRNRPIGHSTDNDARSVAIGVMTRIGERNYGASVRHMALNRGGALDMANALTSRPADQLDADVFFRTNFENNAIFEARAGAVRQDRLQDNKRTDLRASIGFRFSFSR